MCSFGVDVGGGKREAGGKFSLHTYIPLLDITVRMVSAIHLRNGLYYLRQKLLCALGSKTATGRRRNAIRKRKRDRVVGMRSIHRSGIGSAGGVHHVVVGIQRE